MVEALLETDTLIDILRGHPPALGWLSNQSRTFGVSAISWLELLGGAKNAIAQRQTLRLLSRFRRVDLTEEDFTSAIQFAILFHLSHGIGMNDCLIAAPSHRLRIPLFSRNRKHFEPMLGDLVVAPY